MSQPIEAPDGALMNRVLSASLGEARLERWRLARALFQRRRYMLVFSHMRSFSTLLGHLLGSHPQIDGYVEQHRSYETFADLAALHADVWRVNSQQLDGEILFDKVLHDKHRIADDVLAHRDVMPVYALREPLGSLRSIVAMGGRGGGAAWRRDSQSASRHLFNRYRTLRTLVERRADAGVVFTDSLITAPEDTLDALGRHLGLRTPIERDYDRQPMTGVGGFGDPVGPIAAGTIVADRPTHDVEIPERLAARLLDDYRHTAELLCRRCDTIIGMPVDTGPTDTRPADRTAVGDVAESAAAVGQLPRPN